MTSAYDAGTVPPIRVHHRLRIAREWANLDQTELAQMIGISRNSVSSAERGSSQPRQITLNAWALATGVPVSWLKTGLGPTGPDLCPHQGSNLGPADYTPSLYPFTVRRLSVARDCA